MGTIQTKSDAKGIISTDEIHAIFDKLAEQLENDRIEMVTGIASKEKTNFFEVLIKEDMNQMNTLIRNKSTSMLIGGIIGDYLNGLTSLGKNPNQLGFKFGHSIGNVWVVVNDDDDDFIHKLILLEANINSKYRESLGYTLSSMITEKSDRLSMPTGFEVFPIREN